MEYKQSRRDDITVLIGVRNRSDYRIANALRSIRTQTYPVDMVRIMVIDYGSRPGSARQIMSVSTEYSAEYVPACDVSTWSRARCLNIGIRRANTKFLLTSDADILFSRRYLADAISLLKASPPSVVYSPMFDLPQELVQKLQHSAKTGGDLKLEEWKARCKPRFGRKFHPSIGVTYTGFYQLIRGYDEFYETWGAEDADLMQRFVYLGLRPRTLDSSSFYVHQWHPKFEGVSGDGLANRIRMNRSYRRKTHAIMRNDRDWGTRRLNPQI